MMKRSAKIRLITFTLALLLILAGFWADTGLRLSAAQTQLEYGYRRALNDLTDSVAGMRSTLQKAPYVGRGVTQSALSAQLMEQSGGAKAAMAALPLSQERTEKISRFLSQIGDYALSLERRGSGLEDTDVENLQNLEDYAGRLLEVLYNAQARLSAQGGTIRADAAGLGNLTALDGLATLDDDFDEAAQQFAETPSLLYDGPFSDHLNRREPLFLQGRKEITREQAAGEAAGFLQCGTDALEFLGEAGSELPVYAFQWEDAQINITKSGGEAAYFKLGAQPAEENLGYEDALAAARQLLERLGREPFRETYYARTDHLCTVNFAGLAETEDGQEVTCYPDLMKVTVELEAGGIVELDCIGYLMNRHDRALPAPRLIQEEAQESVSPLLTVERAALALIPSPGLDEVLCWEFYCESGDGQRFLSYVNCETGLEEQLYRLQIDENGTLTF